MHIRHLAVTREKTYTLAKLFAHIHKHTHKYIFNIIMTSRTLQESQQDLHSTEG